MNQFDRIPEVPSYQSGFLLSVIQLDFSSGVDIDVDSPDMKHELLLNYIEHETIWFEGIDYNIEIPNEIAKELFFIKLKLEDEIKSDKSND